MEFDLVVEKRKSVRNFSGKKVSWKSVLDAIDSANQGPFAGNHNHLRFLIVENKNKIKKVAEFAEQEWIAECSLLVLVCSDDAHLEDVYGERGRVYGRQQAGAAVQTFLMKLVDIDLSGCWVGAYDDEKVRRAFKIPKHIQIEAIIPIGFEAGDDTKKKKKSLERTLYWEKWSEARRPTMFEEDREDYRAG